ncbi:diacylglycerol kinase family protein [Liquorilactobacillus satsumensis]|nr:diacylglycerol kinase family protein [Liquorilactobacillus satsumensis]MCP9328418.1 transcriptional regulator [Liquorilactobacillus satsumensis]
MRTFFFMIDEEMVNNGQQKTWQKIETALNESQVNFQIISIPSNDQTSRTVQQLLATTTVQEINDCVIVTCGRNEFFLEVLATLLHSAKQKIPVAFIPFETKNAFAKRIGVSFDPLLALKQILNTMRPTFYNLVEMDEAAHTTKKIFLDKVTIGFEAYFASLQRNSKLLIFMQKYHLTFLARLCGLADAFINQERFAATLRVARKYHFFKKAFAVRISNPTLETLAPHESQAETAPLLNVDVISSLNPFSFLILSLSRKFDLANKLPFVHRFKQNQVHLMINSLEFGQIDNRELTNKFYDVFFKIISYPFWFDVTSISLSQRKNIDTQHTDPKD